MTLQLVNLEPQTFAELLAFCTRMATTSFVPDTYRNKPDEILAAIVYGRELGIGSMQSLQGLWPTPNGKVGMEADLMLALVESTGQLAHHREWWDEEQKTGFCEIERKGRGERETFKFSVEDAKKVPAKESGAGTTLDQKWNYKSWPMRMYPMRARTFALRTKFADVLKGVMGKEELEDATIDVTPLRSVRAEIPEQAGPAPGDPSTPQKTPWDLYKQEDHAQIEESFKQCSITPAAQRTLLRQYEGRTADLVDAMKTEWAARNGRKRVGPGEAPASGPKEQPTTGPREVPKPPTTEKPQVGPTEVKASQPALPEADDFEFAAGV